MTNRERAYEIDEWKARAGELAKYARHQHENCFTNRGCTCGLKKLLADEGCKMAKKLLPSFSRPNDQIK